MSSIAIAPPLISVCIATYNGAAYLAAQLDSVLAQTHGKLEILIGDDGSTDETRDILEDYARRDARIRLIFNSENLGYNRNFEALARQAAGEYIAFCDQDDVWAADKLERLLAVIGEGDIAYGVSVLMNAAGQPLGSTLLDKLGLIPVQGTGQRALERGNTVSGHAMLCRGDFVRRNLPFDTRPPFRLYDYYLAMCANLQRGLVYCPEAVTYHRLHNTNSHNTKMKQPRKKGWFWQRWWQRQRNARRQRAIIRQVSEQARQRLHPIKRAAVFAHYDRDNMVDAYVIEYLRALQAVAETIVFVSDSDLPPDALAKVAPFCAHTIAGRHEEYDFGSYKRGLAFLQPTAGQYAEIILANDSCYCIGSFVSVFAKMRERAADFWGMTQARCGYPVHVQSYFLVFRQRLLADARFWAFFAGVCRQENKDHVIAQYEVGLTQMVVKAGYTLRSLIPSPRADDPMLSPVALRNLQQGMPLLKVGLLRDNPAGVCGLGRWKKRVSAAMLPVIHAHLRRALLGKPFVWEHWQYLHWVLGHKPIRRVDVRRGGNLRVKAGRVRLVKVRH
ncbi:MAG: glycosyltransferase [Acidobacteriota bacterium]